MARITPNLLTTTHNQTILVTLLAIFAVLSTVIFLCGAHRAFMQTTDNYNNSEKKKKKKNCERLGGKKAATATGGGATANILMGKLISWRKVQEDGEDDEKAIWKRTIIRGEKCRPVDFSGKISYDSNGNVVVE